MSENGLDWLVDPKRPPRFWFFKFSGLRPFILGAKTFYKHNNWYVPSYRVAIVWFARSFNRFMEIIHLVVKIRLEFLLHGCTIVRRREGICSRYMLDVLFGLVTISQWWILQNIMLKLSKIHQNASNLSDPSTCFDAKSNFHCHLACQQPRWSWS